MSGIIIALKCHWCSKQYPPRDLMHLASGQLMCRKCHEWHHHALDVLANGVIPRGCQQCGITTHVLNSLTDAPTTKMYLLNKDGTYQVLCGPCKDAYCVKRQDLFKGTQFGATL